MSETLETEVWSEQDLNFQPRFSSARRQPIVTLSAFAAIVASRLGNKCRGRSKAPRTQSRMAWPAAWLSRLKVYYSERISCWVNNLVTRGYQARVEIRRRKLESRALPAPIIDGASPGASASFARFARSGSPIIDVNRGFVGNVRTALDVIDEGSQLRHHLPPAGIVEKHARHYRRKRL